MEKLWQWLVQEKHRAWVRAVGAKLYHAFNDHPHAAGETYWKHFWFTMGMALRFIKIAAAIIVHGIFPFLCTRTASNEVKRIYGVMVARAPEPEAPADVPLTAQASEKPLEFSDVAIIGGGFSGAMACCQVIKQAEKPVVIDWFEPAQALGRGLAYGTEDTVHLLNVRAQNMGAWADDPQHFWTWLQSPVGKAEVKRLWAGNKATAEGFVPRSVYAAYLAAQVDEALALAKAKGITVRVRHAEVIDAGLVDGAAQQMVLTAQPVDGSALDIVQASKVIVATGNLAPRVFGFMSEDVLAHAAYVHDVWAALRDKAFRAHVAALEAEDEVCILGSGLTAVDTVMSLDKMGFKGKITVLSRNGWLPQAHDAPDAKPYPAWSWVNAPQDAPKTALGLLVGLRAQVRQAAIDGYDWRRVVDSLRPVTQTLWQQLPLPEKQRFMKRLFTLWNIHRHRMSPDIAARLEALQAVGRLQVVAGRINSVTEASEGLHVNYNNSRYKNVLAINYVKMLVNCTGPDYDMKNSGHCLLMQLFRRGLVTKNALGIGLDMNDDFTARGAANGILLALGTLRLGALFECTAVPELRTQVRDAACWALQD